MPARTFMHLQDGELKSLGTMSASNTSSLKATSFPGPVTGNELPPQGMLFSQLFHQLFVDVDFPVVELHDPASSLATAI